MSPYDQSVYDAGFKYIPRSEFLLNPFQIPQGGGGGATGPVQPGLPSINIGGGGGGGGFNPYNPDMSRVRTDFRPEYDFRRYSEYGMYPSTMDRKQMDMNQDYFYGPPESGLSKMIGGAVNFIPGFGALKRGAEFVGGILNKFMPVNQRAILENQLRGQGVLTDDIGRIVSQPGQYNTPEGIMAGYNAAQMTDATFDKRTGNIAETLKGKYNFTPADINNLNNGIITPEMEQKAKMSSGKTSNLLSNYININLAKQNFLTQQTKAAEIAAFKEAEKVRKESERQYDPGRHGSTNYGLGSDGQQSYSGDALGDKDQGFGINATTGGPVSNKTGRGRTDYMDGGLANLVDIYD